MDKITYIAAKLCGTCNKFKTEITLKWLKRHKKQFFSEIERNNVEGHLGFGYSLTEYNCLYKEIIKSANL